MECLEQWRPGYPVGPPMPVSMAGLSPADTIADIKGSMSTMKGGAIKTALATAEEMLGSVSADLKEVTRKVNHPKYAAEQGSLKAQKAALEESEVELLELVADLTSKAASAADGE